MKSCLGFALLISLALTSSNITAGDNYVGFVSQNTLGIRDGELPLLNCVPMYWDPGWGWVVLRAENSTDGNVAVVESTAGQNRPAQVKIALRVAPVTLRSLEYTAVLTASQDTECTVGIIAFDPGPAIKKSVVEFADGSNRTVEGAYGKDGLGENITAVALHRETGEAVRLVFDKPAKIASDRGGRIVMAEGHYKGNEPKEVKFSIHLDRDLTFYPSPVEIPFEEGFENWYVWKPEGAYGENNPLSMADWAEKPAGQHGRIRREGDKLLLGDKPIKLWGINLCYAGGCAPSNKLADKRAAFYAHHGVNAVRLHKYAEGTIWSGIQSEDSFVNFNPVVLDKMDYQIAKFCEYGIYIKLSAHFGTASLGRGDLPAIPYLEEFGKFGSDANARVIVPAGCTYFSREAQDIQIAHYVNLLKHRNPYRDLTYAEDPAIAFIEILNEQSALFFSVIPALKSSPTLTKRVGEEFCSLLREKYGDHEGLLKAWGPEALNSFGLEGFATSGEHLDANNILPIGNPWFWDIVNLDGSQAYRRQRLLDSMTFLTMLQDDFYARFVKAIHEETDYKGEIIASNWQAGNTCSHFMNLHSDYLVGTIDRHNYFYVVGRSMMPNPGSGLLGTGLQQVADRPFMISEWVHVKPNEYGIEGPATIGAYGMGLQGWDASFAFHNEDSGTYLPYLWRSKWEVTTPQIFGIFPAVARHVLRGDIQESELQAIRKVHVPSLSEGRLGFDNSVDHVGDVKELGGRQLPAAALAVARCPIVFTDEFEEMPEFDLTPFLKGDTYESSTGQLRWTAGDTKSSGFFTIDTPATQAVVGFAAGQPARLSQATITTATKFAAVYVTPARPKQNLSEADSLVVVALARARNSGRKVIGETVAIEGTAPILIEPVKATISLNRPGTPIVRLLDHDGNRTDKTLPVTNGTFTIDGARDQTPYYEISYAD